MRFSKLLALILIGSLIAGCLPTPTPTPTVPAPATATPAATSTPQPTSTPTAAPTSTPAPTATPDPRTTSIRAELAGGIDPTHFGAGQALTVNFDRAMDPASATTPLQTYPYLPGKAAWNPERTALKFAPDSAWGGGQDYYVFLDRNLKDVYGKTLPELAQWKLHIQEGPRLVEETLDPGVKDPFQPAFRLTFDQKMNHASVEKALRMEPAAGLEFRWTPPATSNNSSAETLTVQVRATLTAGQVYRFTLGKEAQGLDGAALDRSEVWTYRPEPLRVVIDSFTSGKLNLAFNYAPDWTKVIPLLEIDPPVPGEWKALNDLVLEFSTPQGFDLDAQYTVRAKTALPIKDYSQPLAMAPLQATPTSGITNRGNPDDWYSRASYTFDFSAPMDHATTEAAFSADPPLDGKFEWSNGGRSLTFSAPWGNALQYTLTIGTSARDASGRKILNQPHRVNISIPLYTRFRFGGDKTSPALFGVYGLRFQAVDAGGRRAIQISNTGNTSIQLGLTPLSLDDFARRLRAFSNSKDAFVISNLDAFQDLRPVRTWSGGTDTPGLEEVIIPGDVSPGLYVLSMASPNLTDYLFVAITRHTLVVKQGTRRVSLWATDFRGRPSANLEVHLYNQQGSALLEGTTGADGAWSSAINPGVEVGLALAVAGKPEGISLSGDVAVSGLDGNFSTYDNTIDGYQNYTGVYSSRSISPAVRSAAVQIYGYTERPIYQPGQMVYYKGIVREEDDARYTTPPAGTEVKVSLSDPRGNLLANQTLTTNDFGGVDGAFQLAEEVGLGFYTVKFEIGKQSQNAVFEVQEYIKPQIEFKLRAVKTELAPGEAVELDVDLRYLTGQPVPNRSVEFKAFMPAYSCYFCIAPNWLPINTSLPGGQTDENGHLHIRLNIDNKALYTYSWAIQASTYDDLKNPVSQTIRLHSLWNAEKIEIHTGRTLYQAGEVIQARIKVSDAQGRGVAGRAVAVETSTYTNQGPRPLSADQRVVTGSDGWVTVSIQPGSSLDPSWPPPGSGKYTLTARAGDDPYSGPRAYTFIYYTTQGLSSSAASHSVLAIRTENTTYKPYETARFTIESDFAGPALVTFERASVLRSVPVQLTPPLTVIEQNLGEECAPNVFVRVSAWKPVDITARSAAQTKNPSSMGVYTTFSELDLISDSVEIQVDAALKKLNLKLTPSQKEYGPRQEASFALEVSDAAGKPVRAEVSLALVDEAIYSLKSGSNLPIFDFFYGRRDNQVSTYTQMEPYRMMADRSPRGGGGGPIEGVTTRSEFADTAIWLPSVVTGADGKATVKVTLPDDLTEWRLTALAATLDTRVGEATATITTTRPVIVRPALPNGLTTGDRSQLAALVSNTSKNPVRLEVRLEIAPQGILALEGAATTTIDLQPGEIRPVTWWAKAVQSGEAILSVSAFDPSRQVGDAIRLPFSVQPLNTASVTHTNVTLGGKGGSPEIASVVVKPPNADPASRVQVSLSRGMPGSLLKGLNDLIHYPYGCVEQTMSAALPNALIARAFHQAGLPVNPDLNAKISAGLQRLYGMQHRDGGWGWWSDDSSDVYMTAWVLFGLSLTRDSGALVAQNAIDQGVQYLQGTVNAKEKPVDARTQAFALYSLALAGKGNLEQTRTLARQSGSLDAFSNAALALALERLEQHLEAEKLLDEVSVAILRTDGQAYLPGLLQDGEYRNKAMSSQIRTTALVMDALVKIRPGDARIAELEAYLIGQRGTFGWGTTNETAFAILALSDDLQQQKADLNPIAYRLSLNGAALSEGSLDPNQEILQIEIPADKLLAGANLLHLASPSQETRLYATFTSQMYIPEEATKPAGNLGLERTYYPMGGKTLADLQPGDLVEVRLTYPRSSNANYLMISDHLPGGLEAVNDRLNTGGFDGRVQYGPEVFHFGSYGYNRKEIRANQVLFFVTSGSTGGTITYTARVTRPGDYRAAPAEMTLMYDSTRWGRSSSARVTVQEAKE